MNEFTLLNFENLIRVEIQYVMRCAIWYHLYNLKHVKNTRGGVLQAN